ncbi:MAG: cupin domain-containing protein [Candidatus Omnitrophica bacterium]|nr:cupin domain-containing protein [Candidatus Omnitrophota bacterium]
MKKTESKQNTSPKTSRARIPSPRLIDPAKSVQYQKSSIVSKVLADKKAGTITLFAFDKGQRLSEHTAPYDAVVLILEGGAEISIGGRPCRLGKGKFIIMPAHVPHAVTAVQRFKMLLCMIRSS